MGKFEVKTLFAPECIPVIDIIFVHGLGGDCIQTWTHANTCFWPNMLSKDIPAVRILSVNHPSPKLAKLFEGGGMGLVDRSKSTLELLETYDVGCRPTIFITHSLGGLITKGMLRKAHDVGGEAYNTLLNNVAGIAFLATPHKGSAIANVVSKIPGVASEITKDLEKDTDQLKDLHDWYVQRAKERGIRTRAFFETHKDKGVTVVPETSAHPGTHDGTPTAVDSNHVDICKFEDENDATYRMIKKFILDCCKGLDIDPSDTVNPSDFDYYTSVVEGDRKTLKEKLEDAGRDTEVKNALREKERIAEELYRNAISPSAQRSYKNFLGDIVSRFRLAVEPHISGGSNIAEVNSHLQKSVIDPISQTTHKLANQSDIHGAIYYLTGNCHIKWSAKSDD